jgi:hypothetical protein
MWQRPQLLDVVYSSKMRNLEVEFEFREKKKVTRTLIRRLWGLQKHWNTIFGQIIVDGDGSVTRSVVVMQHRRVCMNSSSVKMSWTVL